MTRQQNKYQLLLVFGLFVFQILTGQSSNNINGFITYKIDSSIKRETEEIIKLTSRTSTDTIYGYENNLWLDLYINDKLSFSTVDSSNIRPYFLSTFWYSGDTVNLLGYFDTYRNQGFLIKIHSEKALIFYREFHPHYKHYRLHSDESYRQEILVPCYYSSLILDKYPKANDLILFGLLELESKDYYSTLGNDRQQKERVKIKIYFRSEKKFRPNSAAANMRLGESLSRPGGIGLAVK
jgi:hypothetical protein